jgi:hypothetical protein
MRLVASAAGFYDAAIEQTRVRRTVNPKRPALASNHPKSL